MDIKDLHTSIEGRFDKLDNKLDDHLGRISKTEADVHWLKGHVKISVSIGLVLLTGAITYIINGL